MNLDGPARACPPEVRDVNRIQQEERWMFSAMQTHVNKVFGQQMPLLDVVLGDRALSAQLSEESKREMKCTHTHIMREGNDCGAPATHFACLGGIEMLCCAEHADLIRRVNRQMDAASWFCRELTPDKTDSEHGCMWFIAWRIPEELREDFGVLKWLWYPSADTGDHENSVSYSIHREPSAAAHLPEGARWEPITVVEAAHLLGQLIYETQRGKQPYIVGFAPDEPFDRPDPSLGYSVSKHVCSECVSDMLEPYCFNFKKTARPDEVARTWEQADIIYYTPDRGEIKAVRFGSGEGVATTAIVNPN